MGSATKKAATNAKRTLEEFVKAKRIEEYARTCAVCQLPAELKDQIRTARKRGITGELICQWVQEDHSRKLSPADYTTHVNGRHDERAG